MAERPLCPQGTHVRNFRSVLEHPSIRSPPRDYTCHIFPTESHVQNFRSVFKHAQSVRLHGKTHRLFSGRSSNGIASMGQIFCTRLRSRMRCIFRSRFIYRRASAYSSNFLECDPDFSVRIFTSEHQFVRLQENNVIKIFRFARSRSSIGATNSLAFKEPM